MFFFFFSSRRRHTRFSRDWSSDVCSSDLIDVSSVSGATAGAVPRATVRFEQTGINLKVTPHVTANRQVLMEVHAERSNVKPASVDIGFTFQTQQADNQILVK